MMRMMMTSGITTPATMMPICSKVQGSGSRFSGGALRRVSTHALQCAQDPQEKPG